MKKTMALVMAVVTLFSCVLFFTSCDTIYGLLDRFNRGKTGDGTFEGALSTESFQSEKEAVQGFLADEIAGEAADATLVAYQETKQLSSDEIDKLVLDGLDKKSIVSAKEVEITYDRSAARAAAADSDEDHFLFTVYVLEISRKGVEVHEFKYYVPKAKDGDVLTRSYFENVLDPAKYVNCTQEYTSKSTTELNGQKLVEIEQNFVVKVADNKAYLEAQIFDPTSIRDSQNMQQNVKYITLKAYFEYDKKTGTFSAYCSLNDAPYVETPVETIFAQLNITEIRSDMTSLATMNFPKIDYSYYEKTDFGFKIQESFLNQYLGMSLDSIAPNGNVDCTLNVYVTDGRIESMESNADITVPSNNDTVRSRTQESLKFKDFGTTVVTMPKGIQTDSNSN